MRGFVLAALALAAVVPSAGIDQLTRVDVSLGDVSINKVPQLVAADQGLYAKYGLDVHQTISAGAARAALAKWFNITDARTQDGMFAYVNKFEKKPYPSVDGIEQVFALYDSPEMRKHTPDEFYDSSLMAELDKSGFLDNPK